MIPAVGRLRALLLAAVVVFGISLIIFCINLFVNPWWIALWRFFQSVVLFSLLLVVVVKWIIPWMMPQQTQEEVEETEGSEQVEDVAGQHVDLVADDSRDEELNA